MAGFRAFATVFATFPATAFNIDLVAGFAAVLPLAGSTDFAVVLLTLLAGALLVADLVTVAFIVPSYYETPDLRSVPENLPHRFQAGLDTIGRSVRRFVDASCQTTTSTA